MKRKSIVAALMVCAALLVPAMAMAAVKTAPAPVKDKITGDVNYEVMCNDKTIFSVIINEKMMTPHKDGKVYTGLFKKAMNFNTEGKAISSKEWSKVAKVVNCVDPFSKANLKKAVEENAKSHNYILPKDFEENLLEARDNYYVDSTLGLHALYAPGMVAAESAGWIDIKIG